MKIFAGKKLFTKIYYDITLGARYYQFMQKTRHQKSHATVRLSKLKKSLNMLLLLLLLSLIGKSIYSFLTLVVSNFKNKICNIGCILEGCGWYTPTWCTKVGCQLVNLPKQSCSLLQYIGMSFASICRYHLTIYVTIKKHFIMG